MTINNQIKKFYQLLGHEGDKSVNVLRQHFPNDYDLAEITTNSAEDFILQNQSVNKALLVAIEIGQMVASVTRPKILNAKFSEEIGRYAQRQLGHLRQEQLCIALLDAQLNVIGWETVFIGSLIQVQASPREIFQRVLKANALGFMIIHNHPSGNVMPSEADINFSRRLNILGEEMAAPMFDSFVVTHDSYWSLSENGQLKVITA
ncbi:JAB domain-containing protein [Leuconostoc palmae]|uniref:JAB domain-containing protein n=1 Tax=Leuconostoc palmae TaxID=501487 RepID=UPI001C7CBFA9|nr:JAB domain-containing protein [Leuconostoc palmae]